jgi:hypothetical protein
MKRKPLIILSASIVVLITLWIINPGNFFTLILLRAMGHYKTPRNESPDSIKKYTSDKGLYYDQLYIVSNYESFKEIARIGVEGVPTIQIFDHNKRLLRMAEQSDCTWVLSDYFKEGHGKDMIAFDSTSFPYVMERIIPVDIKTSLDTFDYYVISYWAKYLPKLSNQLFDTTNKMKKSMKDNICFVYVSMDKQENWE